MNNATDASSSPAWPQLQTQALRLLATPTAALFATDPLRAEHCTVTAAGLTLDWSRQRVDAPVLALLSQLADDIGLRERIAAMYRGDVVNVTEQRQVLHTALRRPNAPYAELVRAERERMLDFAEGVRGGGLRGSHGPAAPDGDQAPARRQPEALRDSVLRSRSDEVVALGHDRRRAS